jgi:hypothetical protein
VGDAAVLDAAQAALARAFAGPVRLGQPTVLKSWQRNDVWRCPVADGPSMLGASVVVKHFKNQPERGLDDWASLDFLTGLATDPAVAPSFLAGDRAAGVFVMEDLGPGRTLEDLLLAGDERLAAEALAHLAVQTARLHGATLQRRDGFDRLRDGLASRASTPIARAAAEVRRCGVELEAWLVATGVTAPAALASAIEALARLVEEPGPFAAFTHGDMAPGNNHIAGTRVTLLDFEYGGVRHALYDTLLWALFCPFPSGLIERADMAYRAELGRRCAAAGDDRVYGAARSAVAAWRTANLLQWLPPSLLDADGPWAPGMSARQAILYHLERFQIVGAAEPKLTALVETFSRLRDALRARWGAETDTMLVWPAFSARWVPPAQ